VGIIESANGGIVFLDEVGELSPAVQGKLLRLIQNQEIQRVGTTQPQHVDVLLIAATGRDLEREAQRGQFRADLFFRLNMIEIRMPPLRERVGDIPLLYRYFLEKFNQQYGKDVRGISRRAQDLLLAYPWPGNVRELENAVGRACMLARGSFLDVGDFAELSKRVVGEPTKAPCSLEEAERAALVRALDASPNKSQAARILGVSRPRLYRLMEKHGLTTGKDGNEPVPKP
jgi:DNA-binding NtrC family response regulator